MDEYTPKVPDRVRTWAYGVGIGLGLGAAPALLALNQPALAGVAAALAGAANALAFGYRPTRPSAS
ncbi:hypothetical protein EXU48_15725 [Occultella glacieicola]|uniref:Uncharacterized protein n=1 Tax=Occultella glacieicola TaxID=2518684 RepID=A0ABY2E4A8_9MICO|nr:hypothetical protein [Occultella glacieicola]TDE91593.1 hypothetical protein EXU48_15725 [Occultella glacieicola]